MIKTKFWQKRWLPGLIISLLSLSLGWTGFMSSLEWQVYSMGERLSPSPKSTQNLDIIAIDETSLQQLGEWPWPRSYFATIIKKLNAHDTRTIGLTLPLHTSQSDFGVRRLDSMRDTYKGKYKKTVKDILFLARQRLDTDGALAVSLKNSDNTVLAMTYGLNNDTKKGPSPLINKHPLDSHRLRGVPQDRSHWTNIIPSVLTSDIPTLTQIQTPIPKLARNSYVGLLDESISRYRNSLVSPLIMKYAGQYYPSFNLVFAAQSLGINTNNIKIGKKQNISLWNTRLNTDPAYRIYPRLYASSNSKPAFKLHSFSHVFSNNQYSQFKDKDVLIGITAPSLVDQISLPGGNNMPAVILNAHIINNLLQGDLFAVPEWALLAQMTIFLLVLLYLTFVLPRLKFWNGLISSLILLFILVNIQFGFMLSSTLWVPLMLPIITLLTGTLAIAVRRKIEDSHLHTKQRLFESNLTLAQHLQSQGQLDQAFEKYRACPINDTLLDRLYSLGLDYERRRQFSKAILVFEHIKQQQPEFRDAEQRMQKNHEIQDMIVLNKGQGMGQESLILTDKGVQKPMLGRYQLEKEIGRGAMGMVYLGKDPKIGRTVAIKTMALADEFEAEDLEEIKQRFLREAETAGRLNHQNIVTIYDVGEEQELAYIAMDFLQGSDLSKFRKFDSLLALEVVIDIGIQIATALDFAHKHDVVHRDIKPANIIYDESTGSAKVTDFGVACLTNSSKTKTGTMLGSPSYMSPEQAEGKKVDGGSDLFSLGVMLYQLTTSKLPFVSDTLSGLVYKICNEKQVDANKVNLEVPACLSRVFNKSMNKAREERYKTGAQMAKALRKCLNSIEEINP